MQISIKLLTLSQIKNKDLYIYYCQTKTLLIEIFRRNQVTHNRENSIVLNNKKQNILKYIIAKFSFSLKILKFYLYMIKYRVDLMRSFYGAFKKTKVYLDILNAKV